jgi:hypothetical protein
MARIGPGSQWWRYWIGPIFVGRRRATRIGSPFLTAAPVSPHNAPNGHGSLPDRGPEYTGSFVEVCDLFGVELLTGQGDEKPGGSSPAAGGGHRPWYRVPTPFINFRLEMTGLKRAVAIHIESASQGASKGALSNTIRPRCS